MIRKSVIYFKKDNDYYRSGMQPISFSNTVKINEAYNSDSSKEEKELIKEFGWG